MTSGSHYLLTSFGSEIKFSNFLRSITSLSERITSFSTMGASLCFNASLEYAAADLFLKRKNN